MADSTHRNAFLVHLAAYVVVNAILFAINASLAVPEGETREWWVLYPLAGWGIGLAAHGLGLWTERHAHESKLLADPDVRGVAIHLFVYLAVNAFLIAINITQTPDSYWSVWPLLGWGAGLAAHAWLAYRGMLHRTVERYAKEQQILSELQMEKELERQAAAIASQIAPEEHLAGEKAPAKGRKRVAKKGAKKAPARKGAPKRAAAKSASTTRTRKASTASKSRAKKTASAKKPASRSRKRSGSTGRTKGG